MLYPRLATPQIPANLLTTFLRPKASQRNQLATIAFTLTGGGITKKQMLLGQLGLAPSCRLRDRAFLWLTPFNTPYALIYRALKPTCPTLEMRIFSKPSWILPLTIARDSDKPSTTTSLPHTDPTISLRADKDHVCVEATSCNTLTPLIEPSGS